MAAAKLAILVLILGLLAWGLPALARATIEAFVSKYAYDDVPSVPSRPIAIVFGAAVWSEGRLSNVLADRVDMAVELYRAGKVRKIMMTGDNRFAWYNEPGAMGEYAMQRGVPAKDIIYDYAGRRTYDSCYRARHIFDIEGAVLVTQAYHLPRALYTCRQVGIDSVGLAADRQSYGNIVWFTARELPAMLLAWWETTITHPLPVMGDKIPIRYD